jgi:metal-responsive CopG/Arc/MetJ family transcriptional regulator
MKTAVSLPDELFESVERIVKQTKRHRSEVYAEALREYVARHAPEDETTRQINEALEAAGDLSDDYRFSQEAARKALRKVEW